MVLLLGPYHFCFYGAHLCIKCSLGITNFLEEIFHLSHSIVFLYFFALITEEGFLISPCCSLEFCIQMGIFFLFSFAWPFRYDLNQIPYTYTMEVTNRFKGLDLIECLKNYGQRFMTLYRRQGSRWSLRKTNTNNKMAVWGGLTSSCEKKGSEKQSRKGKIYSFECRVPKNSKQR